MPTWLVHGFRWPRAQVRIHTILQNLDDVAPEWLMAPATQACLHTNFNQQWPAIVARLPGLRFIEQYDPDDLTVKDQPYAYVCDQVHDIRLGIDIDDARGDQVSDDQLAAIAELRDKVTPDAKLGWFVVVNGDVERWAPPLEDEDELADEDDEDAETKTISPPARSLRSSVWTGSNSDTSAPEPVKPQSSRSMKNWIGGIIRKTRSSKSLRSEAKATPAPPVPPLPPMSPKAALQSPPATLPLRSAQ
ncbi:hypothetical protein C7974DRAFT_324566 [Boeremia exigua]|uniref:uncharacterized protein n=1 Tax=Boeremia exigua TaxID=749465 RepID=UPI001E8D56B0|nr:uncharacterized protein C7974DRAFT_324566 [Boeremia exigua]KAH6643669.1 hypothetical protein C7974DRAFT_324566 [Boeremia exigua]